MAASMVVGNDRGMSSNWAASALNWWQEAGVDTLVAEEPRNWLAPRAAPPPAAPEPVPAATTLPADLDAFRAWLLDRANLPLGTGAAPRIGPSGDPASGLMVIIDMPAQEDQAAGQLLSGSPGALFDKMIAAIGRSRETLWLASLSPARSPTGRFDAAQLKLLGEVARHHIALVRPKALLLFGDATSRALLGASVIQTRGRWHDLDLPGGAVKTISTIRPAELEQQPNLKKTAWGDLQMLMEELKA